MTRLWGALALLGWAVLYACPASAANTTATGTAEIVTPLSLVNRTSLNFGAVIAGASSGTVTIDPFTEARTTTGGVTAYGGTVSAAKFDGNTTAQSHLKIDIPNGSITITRVGGGATMTVSNFTLNGNKNDWINATSLFTIQVGGTLNVGANQMAGTYTGTFTVTVNYR